jgi:hypothetical protein
MNVKFYLDGKSDVSKYIFLEINRFNIKISTKQKVRVDKWDKKKQRAKGNFNLNQMLDTLERICLEEIQINIASNQMTTKDKIIRALNRETTLFQVDEKVDTFYKYAYNFAELNKWGDGYTNHFFSWLNGFNKLYPGIKFEDMDYMFYRKYRKYGLENYKLNTFNGHWRKLKRVLNDAHFSGKVIDVSYNKIKVGTERPFKTYLTNEEIELWYNKLDQLPERLYNVSALFLIGCMSGMRYSDFKDVKSNKIYKDEKVYYRVFTKKTSTPVTIPGNKELDYLLSLNLKDLSNQKMNQYIKEAARDVGITSDVVNEKGEVNQKCDLIETHTARRSFATNAVLSGIPIQFVMSITGHKTESEFRKYVKIDDVQNAIQFNSFKKLSE